MKEENGDGEAAAAAADGEAGKEADGKKGKKAKKEKKKKEPKEKKPPGPNCIDTLSAGLDVTFRDGKAINTCIDVSSSIFCTGFLWSILQRKGSIGTFLHISCASGRTSCNVLLLKRYRPYYCSLSILNFCLPFYIDMK